jgi:hypothetical protein
MKYVKIAKGVPSRYSVAQLKKDNPLTSFPKDLPDELLATWNVHPVVDVQPAALRGQMVEIGRLLAIDGIWTQQYTVRAMTPEESDSALAEERIHMQCTPLQGILELGEENWNKVLDFRDGRGEWAVGADGVGGPATFETTAIINSSNTWKRLSPDMVLLGYLLSFSPEAMDTHFRRAMLRV